MSKAWAAVAIAVIGITGPIQYDDVAAVSPGGRPATPPAACGNGPSWSNGAENKNGVPCDEQPPLALGGSHSCALVAGGKVICWGNNAKGQLGYGDTELRGDEPGEMGDNLGEVDLAGAAKAIAAGTTHTCALMVNGDVKCWGNNDEGRLGHGDTVLRGNDPDEMGPNLPVTDVGGTPTAIVAGHSHMCVLLTDGAVKCWGGDIHGYGSIEDIGDEPDEMGANLPPVDLGGAAVSIAAGDNHTCALLTSGVVKCWGKNLRGQLGYGDVSARGDNPGEMGAALAPVELGLTGGVTVRQITAGENHTCALLSNGTVKCWGKNTRGQLGIGTNKNRGDKPNQMGSYLGVTNLGGPAISISAGENHTCAVLADLTVKCWGNNEFGHLGHGDTNHRGDNTNEMGAFLPATDLDGPVDSVVAGDNHTCAVLIDGRVKCWGKDEIGHLGHGTGVGIANHRGDSANEMGANLPTIDLGRHRF